MEKQNVDKHISTFQLCKLVHGNRYLRNTDFALSLKVYETIYTKASLDLNVENAEVGSKTFRNFSVWDRQETKVMFVCYIRMEVLRVYAGSKWS